MSWLYDGFVSQFYRLPLPPAKDDGTLPFAGQTILVTGANGGLGLEAARHFVQLGAARVVLGCRTTEKAEAAAAEIKSSSSGACQIDAWTVDLGSFASVQAFCQRAVDELDRLDAVVENAGMAAVDFHALDQGYESTIAVNVVGTFLMALLLVPVLRRTAVQHNVQPHLTIVASNAHYMFKDPAKMNGDRYNVSKLLEVLVVRHLADVFDAHHIPIIVNCLTPGLCKTELFRSLPTPFQQIVQLVMFVMARSAEVGSRTLVAAAAAGPESQGQYMDSCVVWPPSKYVLSEAGKTDAKTVYDELLGVLEGIHPGISKNLE